MDVIVMCEDATAFIPSPNHVSEQCICDNFSEQF